MDRRLAGWVFAGGLCLNLLAWYGGIRSPDSEVVFALCEALHDRRSVAIHDESRDTGFGVAPGRGGRLYSIFGPGESLACVPFLTIARLVDRTHWYAPAAITPPPSFYVGGGYERFEAGERPAPREAVLHAERTIVSLLNPIVSALAAVVFFAIASRFARTRAAALGATVLYAAGTLAWVYAGGFFSEPLATLCVLLSCYFAARPTVAGLALGAAIATHITAILFVPFLAAIAIHDADQGEASASSPRGAERHRPDRRVRAAAWFAAGLGAALALLAIYDAFRFGDPFETGRGVDPELARAFGYGVFTAPWRGLYGLLLSPGKGVLLYAPAVIVGAIGWRAFHRERPFTARVLAVAAITRILFLAARSDWHAGFCLGPRYLVMLLPFLVLPVVTVADRWPRAFTAATILCVAQQTMFAIGEPFTYYQRIRIASFLRGVDPFVGDRIYLSWPSAPVVHLLGGLRGPWLLRALPVGNVTLWLVLATLFGAAIYWGFGWAMRKA